MRACSSCERPTATARVESSHATSEGVVRYLRCRCGHRWIEIAHLVLVHAHTAARAAISDGESGRYPSATSS